MTAELPQRTPDLTVVATPAGLPGASNTIGKLAAALAKAQAEFGEVKKTKTAQIKSDKGSYSYTYASLDDVLAAVLPALSKHGVALLQPATRTQSGVNVETLLLHESGEWIGSGLTMPASGGTAQSVGSAITYAKRYGLSSILGIAAEEDDDGQTAGTPAPYSPPKAAPVKKLTAKQMSTLVEKLVSSGMTKPEAAKAASGITPDKYPEALKRAEARIAEAAETASDEVPPCTTCSGKGADESTGEVCSTCSGTGTQF